MQIDLHFGGRELTTEGSRQHPRIGCMRVIADADQAMTANGMARPFLYDVAIGMADTKQDDVFIRDE